jgi:hypothetical protein
MNRLSRFGASLFGLSIAISSAQATELTYKFKTLALTKANSTELIAVNASGMMLGNSTTEEDTSTCYLIDGSKKTAVKYPGARVTTCGGINKSGVVVGYYTDAKNVVRGFSLTKGKYKAVTLGTLVVKALYPTSISDNGTISGFYFGPIGAQIFTLAGKSILSFHVPATNATYGYGINNAGHISLVAETLSDGPHAYFKHGSTYTNADFPGASQTNPGQINNLDQIVGTYFDKNGMSHGYVYDGKKNKFYTVDGPSPNQTSLSGIDDSGTVVGTFAPLTGNLVGAIGTGHIPN